MQNKQYTTINKSNWPRGSWDNEPDKKQWQDEATGMPCLIVRGPSGALCGYVGVVEGHPLFGKGYDDVRIPTTDDESDYPDVHGGLTFANFCADTSREHWEKWRDRLLARRDEAKQYPIGDAANYLKDWAAELNDYDAWLAKGETRFICHLPDENEPAHAYWFGFDCAHSGDYCPAYSRGRESGYETYKTLSYVEHQCASLAKQLKACV